MTNVVLLRDAPPIDDPAGMAAKLSSDIASGTYGDVRSVVAIVETDSGLELFGWKDADQCRAIGLLHMAIAKLAAGQD